MNEKLELPKELFDHIKILEHSAKIGRYPPNNWLEENGTGCGKKNMYASIFRHVAKASVGIQTDRDSGLDHRLHAAIRLMMDYVRDRRRLVHNEDKGDIKNNIKNKEFRQEYIGSLQQSYSNKGNDGRNCS